MPLEVLTNVSRREQKLHFFKTKQKKILEGVENYFHQFYKQGKHLKMHNTVLNLKSNWTSGKKRVFS